MKKFILICSAIVTLMNGLQSQGIQFFNGNYKTAFENAFENDKLVFVDAYAVWCGPCKRMAKNVFPLSEVGTFFNSRFINMKIDMEKGQGLEFRKEFPVRAFPTFFFIDGEGNIIHKITGGRSAEGLISEAKKALEKFDNTAKYKKLYSEGNRDFETIFGYIKYLNNNGQSPLKVVNEYYRKAESSLSLKQRVLLLSEASVEVDSKVFEEFISMKKQAIRQLGKEKFESIVLLSARNTFDKSLEFESQELKDLSLKAVRKHAKAQFKKFSIECDYIIAARQSDSAIYLKAAENYFKNVIKDNESKEQELCAEIRKIYPNNADALNLAIEIAENTAHNNNNFENCLEVSSLYFLTRNKQKALEWADLAKVHANGDRTLTQKIDRQIQYIRTTLD